MKKQIKLVATLINISSDVKLVLGVTDVARLNLTLTVGAGHEGVYLRERELTIVRFLRVSGGRQRNWWNLRQV